MIRIKTQARRLLRFLAAMSALLVAVPALAQTTGSIRVYTVDKDGIPVPGVELALNGESLIGGTQTRATDEDGMAQFPQLLPGAYTIDANLAKFNGARATNIQVSIGRETTVPITMQPDTGITNIDVIGQKAVDVNSTSLSTVLSKDFLQKVPAGRSYQEAIATTAGVTGNNGGNPNVGGGAYNETSYMLDGATITDPVTGTFSVNFNFDAIQQIEVLLGGYMPEYGTSVGGIVNLVTASGTNNLVFKTSAYYLNGQWSPKIDERLTSDGFLLSPTGFDQKSQLLQISSLVSGPIVRDKAWFIISYLGERSLFASAGVATPRDFDGNYMLAKLTFQPSTEHRFTAFLQMNPTVIDNIQQSVYTRAEANGRQAQGGFVSQGRWQWFLSEKANLDTAVVVQKEYLEDGPVPCTHNKTLGYSPCKPDELENSSDWETPGRIGFGGAFDSVNWGQYIFDDRWRYSASTKLQILAVKDPLGGTHDLKFGIEGDQLVWDQIEGFSGNTEYFDTNQTYYDPQSLQNYYWLEITGPTTFRTTGSQFSGFAQDSWKPVSNLTINYGSRIDNFVMRNDLGEPQIAGTTLGPRLFASWDPFKDQKTKIATGYGRFNDTGYLDVASFTSARNFGSKLWLGEWFGTPNPYSNDWTTMYDIGPRENTNIAADDLKSPQVDELILILEREVIDDVAVFTHVDTKFSRFMYEYDETNLIYDSDGSTIIGSRLDDPLNPIYRLRTPLLAKRDYVQWDVGARKIKSHRWEGNAVYTFTQSFGSSEVRTSGAFRRDPQDQYNYGPLYTDLTHVVKVNGYWDLPTDPWTQTIGVNFEYDSGLPIDRLYYAENDPALGGGAYSLRTRQRGSYVRYNPEWFLNLSFQQSIDVRRGKFVLHGEVDNVTNNQAPDVFQPGPLYTDNRLLAASRQSPRTFQIGVEYNF
jgi:hypothetical protein